MHTRGYKGHAIATPTNRNYSIPHIALRENPVLRSSAAYMYSLQWLNRFQTRSKPVEVVWDSRERDAKWFHGEGGNGSPSQASDTIASRSHAHARATCEGKKINKSAEFDCLLVNKSMLA